MKPAPAPQSFAGNAGLAFAGARVPEGLIVAADHAEQILAARNRHGKPNADVLRPYVSLDDLAAQGGSSGWHRLLPRRTRSAGQQNERAGRTADDLRPPVRQAQGSEPVGGEAAATSEHVANAERAIPKPSNPSRWVVDFPADMSPEEASLYAEPWRIFKRARGVLRERADAMRIAIARTEWFFAAPLGRAMRGFARLNSSMLPGAGLCVVATDDDFVAAVLESGFFEAWVAAHGGRLRVRHVASFPFPWPPRAGRSELTRVQLERRDAVVRASETDLDDAVTAAYGWRDIEDRANLANRLRSLHSARD